MITNVKFFDNVDDLLKLTGLKSDKELWDADFNLDDWDWGFESPIPLTKKTTTHHKEPNRFYGQYYSYFTIDQDGEEVEHIYKYDNKFIEYDNTEETILYDDVPFFSEQLLGWMRDFCCGFKSTEYNGKYYYMLYHA